MTVSVGYANSKWTARAPQGGLQGMVFRISNVLQRENALKAEIRTQSIGARNAWEQGASGQVHRSKTGSGQVGPGGLARCNSKAVHRKRGTGGTGGRKAVLSYCRIQDRLPRIEGIAAGENLIVYPGRRSR